MVICYSFVAMATGYIRWWKYIKNQAEVNMMHIVFMIHIVIKIHIVTMLHIVIM